MDASTLEPTIHTVTTSILSCQSGTLDSGSHKIIDVPQIQTKACSEARSVGIVQKPKITIEKVWCIQGDIHPRGCMQMTLDWFDAISLLIQDKWSSHIILNIWHVMPYHGNIGAYFAAYCHSWWSWSAHGAISLTIIETYFHHMVGNIRYRAFSLGMICY